MSHGFHALARESQSAGAADLYACTIRAILVVQDSWLQHTRIWPMAKLQSSGMLIGNQVTYDWIMSVSHIWSGHHFEDDGESASVSTCSFQASMLHYVSVCVNVQIFSSPYLHDHGTSRTTLVLQCLLQKIYCSLQQQKAKSVKRGTTITELVVVWSLCSVCTSVTKSKAVILYNTLRFLLLPLQEVGKFLQITASYPNSSSPGILSIHNYVA